MALDDIVDLEISRESARFSLLGFGTPMILAPAAEVPVAFTERLRYFDDPADLLTLGFEATDATYLEAVALMSQVPSPSRFAVGRRATPVAQVVTITPTPVNDATYTIDEIDDGVEVYGPFAYVADASATAAEIVAGLLALINATAIQVTASGTTTLILTADNAGQPFTVAESDANLAQVTTTPNTGIPEDLAAIVAYQPDWYGLLITERDAGSILAAAATIETMRRIFLAQSSAAAVTSAPYNSGTPYTDVASTVRSRGYTRTAIWYHSSATVRLAAAVMGKCLPQVAGSITWKFKTLAGITVDTLTTDQRANLISKYANGYESIAGRGCTFEGTVGEGEFIDVIHGIDRLYSRIQEEVALAMFKVPKIPFTKAGIQTLASAVRTALVEASTPTVRLIAESREVDGETQVPAFTVTPPAIGDISAANRGARTLASNPITFEATLAGAIHVAAIRGTVAV